MKKIHLDFDFNILAIIATIVLMVLKLSGVIAWSWVLVCLPLIILGCITLVLYIILFIISR